MPKVSVYDMTGKQVADTELNDAIFGIEPNKAVMHAMVVNYLANQRQGTQSTLTRTEVRGGGKKALETEGNRSCKTGLYQSSAVGTRRRCSRSKAKRLQLLNRYTYRRLAMKSALSSKVIENEIVVVDKIALEEYKTKAIVEMLKALNVSGKALIVMPEADAKVIKSAANIPGVKATLVNTLNVYDILNYDNFVVSQDAVAKIEEVYA